MGRLLDTIDSPTQLQSMTLMELKQLAEEIRQELIMTTATNGGHLAPNLGVVELTIALHASFNSPSDKFVWDVGHQSYVHKLLTGRRKLFHTLRMPGGLSGFPKRAESEHDAFDTGHSSTSVSAALGMVCARDLSGGEEHVVAVIGDGSLTGGMAFEALNHAGHLGKRFIVILNDNEMSITKNVGALAKYLNKIRMDPTIRKVKEDIAGLLSRIPAVGGRVVDLANRMKDSLKYMVVPGMFFEELGFTYLGPIDGHDIRQMMKALSEAKKRTGPVLLHVVTTKGKGYGPAEANPERFHGVNPFDIATGEPLVSKTSETYTDIFKREVVRLGSEHPELVAITAAMPEGTGLSGFATAYPDRFFDVGIAEQHAVTLAAGLATRGYRPIVAIYSSFAQRAYDQLLHDVCLQGLPLTLILDRAGISGQDGPTHHGVYDISYLRHMPGISILAPSDGSELAQMLQWSMTMAGPIAIRIPKAKVSTDKQHQGLSPGHFEMLESGSDIAIIALGSMVEECRQALSIMKHQGIHATLVNARFAKPLNRRELLDLATSHKLIVTVEEHVLEGGFGSAVMEELICEGMTPRVLRLGLPSRPLEHGSREYLLSKCGLTGSDIATQIISGLGTKRYRLNRKSTDLRLLVH